MMSGTGEIRKYGPKKVTILNILRYAQLKAELLLSLRKKDY